MDFMEKKPDTDELQLARPNGEIIRYNTRTLEFGIVLGNGTVKTYYKTL